MNQVVVGLNAVIVAVTNDEPRILTIKKNDQILKNTLISSKTKQKKEPVSLPFGPLNPQGDRTLELALRGWAKTQTDLDLGYVEQLYTFGDLDRDPRQRQGGPRVISVAYLALVQEALPSTKKEATWQNIYSFFPWEDWRNGQPNTISQIANALTAWANYTNSESLKQSRIARSKLNFGLGDAGWDENRVLERYELLYEAGLVHEAHQNNRHETSTLFGLEMILDHRRILASAFGRLRGKLKYRPLVFELMTSTFTLSRLQRVVEALAGLSLHKQNFRRLVEKGGLVENTGKIETQTGGRPAALFQFRKEVLDERIDPGVGLPGTKLP